MVHVGGSLTNNGLITGTGYGSIIFDGTGDHIAGTKPLKIPTMTVNGTYSIGTTITLTTNTPTLNGTLIFDIAKTNQIILPAYVGTALYYSGGLNVINSGAPPVSGRHPYQFFNAPSYGGAFLLPLVFPAFRVVYPGLIIRFRVGQLPFKPATVGNGPTLNIASSGGLRDLVPGTAPLSQVIVFRLKQTPAASAPIGATRAVALSAPFPSR